jgi:hypothetical protein
LHRTNEDGGSRRLLFLKAWIGLAFYDAMGLGRDFCRLHRLVGKWKTACRAVGRASPRLACDAVNRACLWYPKRVLCLQRSAVTTCLLRGCGFQAQMVVGARAIPFAAHAWVEVEGRAVNERVDVEATYSVWERC